ncbi:HAD-IA family hydrolase [Methylogaea oryzae]|uniref:Phosphatase n=1 Tax=Methylogaea oryzae TaxID=1295382 RepID=A0A8D4VTU9_9GAMM|nr:HAD-IA family hydrolase [Methylogaea oryzae]BBL72522.1 phosphatase [Methylogaea oryzae]
MSLQAVIFDVDGTLADTERDGHRVAFNAAFRELGLDWQWDESTYGELLETGGGKERVLRYIQRAGLPDAAQDGPQAFAASVHAVKTRHFKALLQHPGIPLRPGVARLLRELRQASVRLAIATTSAEESVVALLQANLGEDAANGFDVIGAGDVVAEKKPAPDIYRWVQERLGLDAACCLAVEDSNPGLRAATAAGLKTVVTVNGYTSRQDFAAATAVLSDLGEPERPFRLLRGTAHGYGQVCPALLERWLAQ